MRRDRNQTRLKHYFVAIAWFAAAMAIFAGEQAARRRREWLYRQELAKLQAEAAAAGPSDLQRDRKRRQSLLDPDLITCYCAPYSYRRHLGIAIDLIPHKLLFVVAGVLMFLGHRRRLASLVLGTWTACFWLVQYWPLLLPRSEWSNSLGF